MYWCNPILVRVQKETGKRAVFVIVPAVRLAAVQFHINFITGVQMQDDAVAGVVIVLVGVLCYGTGSDLQKEREETERALTQRQTTCPLAAGRTCFIYSSL